MWTAQFWKDAAERGVKTAAQSVLATWAVGDGILNAFTVDWPTAGGVALGGLALSLLTSLVSLAGGQKGTASLTDTVVYRPTV